MLGLVGTCDLSTMKQPKTFKEAFANVLLNRTGVTMSAVALNKDNLERELRQALRLDGFAGDGKPADDGPPLEVAGDTWSENAEELQKLVRQLGPRNRHLSSEQFLKPFFRHLALPELCIRDLDDDVSRFTKLTFLDVSRNGLASIDHLPPSLVYLKAYNNPLTRFTCKPTPSLAFVGIGHSKANPETLEQISRRFKGLLSLDIGFSEVASLQDLITPLGPLQRLRHLCAVGSPVCLQPFYRLQTLRWLTRLSVLDGAAVTDEEQADAQMLAACGDSVRPRPLSIRLGVWLRKIAGVRALLEPVATEIVAVKRAQEAAVAAEAAEAGNEAPAEAEPQDTQDPISEACAGGIIRLRIRLPDGTWAATTEIPLDLDDANSRIAAYEAAGQDPPGVFDIFSLHAVRLENGEPLSFELGIGEEGSEVDGEVLQEDGLVRLCDWVRRGAAIKVFFRPPMPPPPAEEEEEAGKEEAAKEENGEVEEGSEKRAPEPPEEVDVGGCVIGLRSWLSRTQTDVSSDARASGALPELPEFWRVDVPEVRIVPAQRWLEPEVQLPPLDVAQQRKADVGVASLSLMVDLFAGEPPELEEDPPPPPPPDPKGKKK